MYKNIITEVDQGVGIITLNRPDRHNAFDSQTIGELIQSFAGMASDDAVRVVVLSSTGKSFCAGADLEWMRTAARWTSAENEADARVLAEMLHRLATLQKPTVARIQGPAYGGGVGLVAACDIAVATFDTHFALSEVKLGLIPATIAPHVIAAIGERHARRYMLTAERFSAAEAYRLGLVHEMVADEAALDQALGGIVEALLDNGPGAQAECKELIRAVSNRAIDSAVIADTARRIARVRASDEGRQGIAAFLEGRTPNWIR
jgi:methylglutaconyl-CoA hydratase